MSTHYYFLGFLFVVSSGLASSLACYLILRFDHLHAHLSHDHDTTSAHKYHATPVPRIGGVAIAIGLLAAASGLLLFPQPISFDEFGYLVLAGLTALAVGVVEDLTGRVSISTRLGLTILTAFLGTWLLGAVVERIAVPGFDVLLRYAPFAIAFTVFVVCAFMNSINIIDGYNGLAGGYAVLVLAALAWVSAQVGDALVLAAALAMIGALLGFLVWNYPQGKLFLGDGGDYLLGIWLAELSILLSARHPEVSPWFPALLLLYPVFETIFSIYRKYFLRDKSPGQPDGLHLHMLIYKRLVRVFVGTKDATLMVQRNSMVAAYIWAMSACCVLPAIFFWRETRWLAFFSLVFCVSYVWLYFRIVSWHAPAWAIRRE